MADKSSELPELTDAQRKAMKAKCWTCDGVLDDERDYDNGEGSGKHRKAEQCIASLRQRLAAAERERDGLKLQLSAADNVASTYIPCAPLLHDKVVRMGLRIEKLELALREIRTQPPFTPYAEICAIAKHALAEGGKVSSE